MAASDRAGWNARRAATHRVGLASAANTAPDQTPHTLTKETCDMAATIIKFPSGEVAAKGTNDPTHLLSDSGWMTGYAKSGAACGCRSGPRSAASGDGDAGT